MEAQLQATADPIHRRPLAALSRVEGEQARSSPADPVDGGEVGVGDAEQCPLYNLRQAGRRSGAEHGGEGERVGVADGEGSGAGGLEGGDEGGARGVVARAGEQDVLWVIRVYSCMRSEL